MSESMIRSSDGKPRLFIDGKRTDAAAYITYFTERERYRDFADAGYTLFSVCAYFTALPINEQSGFTPARIGIFDRETPDYSEIDRDLADLLAKVPEAKVFLRVYISMPERWLRDHPREICPTDDTETGRELLYSDAFREDGGEMLRAFIAHVRSMPYADAVIGYQLSGGGTQEWFHHDRKGALCENALPYFRRWMARNHPGEAVPDLPERYRKGEPARGLTERFLAFDNRSVAETVGYFCKIAKNCVQNRQVIGAFYGYAIEVTEPDTGSHDLTELLDSPYIDFFDSPVSYTGGRALGMDWVSMVPENSVEKHGKMFFVEADVRTHLSLYPDECRPGHFRTLYRDAIWKGGPTEELAADQIRKNFAKMLTHSGSFWWFDMWGGWYACDRLMEEMKIYRRLLAAAPLGEEIPKGKMAVFADETAARRLGGAETLRSEVIRIGNCGVPYDLFLTCDFEDAAKNYLAVLLLPGSDPEFVSFADTFCRENGIVRLETGLPLEELRSRAISAGVGIYAGSDDVVYAGNGFVALHAAAAGEKTLTLPFDAEWDCPFDESLRFSGNRIRFRMDKFETAIFRIREKM